jgi:hypothetical protein
MKSKYSNKIVTIDGIKFRSIREGNRYKLLKVLEKNGNITGLVLQPKFVLVEDKSIGFKLTYVADFQYTIQGANVVEDVKGAKFGAAYEMFKIKKRLMWQYWKILIKEI